MKREHFWMTCAAAGATAAIIGGTATAALAQQQGQSTTIVGERAVDEDTRSVQVSYRDLNLALARDERILKSRVGAAARVACGSDDSHVGDRTFVHCLIAARTGAKPQVALAVRRAREIAATDTSSIPLVAIAVLGAR